KTAEFSPDGKRIVTASLDGSARVWDANSGLPLTQPLKHGGPVRDAEFSPDGQRVITASDDGTAVIWDIGPPPAPVPGWLLSLAEMLSGQVLTTQGVPQQLNVDQTPTAKQILAELNKAPDAPWARWGRWLLADPSTRTLSPYSQVPITKPIENS